MCVCVCVRVCKCVFVGRESLQRHQKGILVATPRNYQKLVSLRLRRLTSLTFRRTKQNQFLVVGPLRREQGSGTTHQVIKIICLRTGYSKYGIAYCFSNVHNIDWAIPKGSRQYVHGKSIFNFSFCGGLSVCLSVGLSVCRSVDLSKKNLSEFFECLNFWLMSSSFIS